MGFLEFLPVFLSQISKSNCTEDHRSRVKFLSFSLGLGAGGRQDSSGTSERITRRVMALPGFAALS